jgi:hypothetical protein
VQVVAFEVVRTGATTFALRFPWVNDDTGKPASVGFRWGATQPTDRTTLTGKRDYMPTSVAVIGQTFQSTDIAIPTGQARTYFSVVPYRLTPSWVGGPWSPYQEIVWATLTVPTQPAPPPVVVPPPPPPPPPPPVVVPPPPPPPTPVVTVEVVGIVSVEIVGEQRDKAIVIWADGTQARVSKAMTSETP